VLGLGSVERKKGKNNIFKKMVLQIVYWPIRGMVNHVLCICECLGIDYEFIPLNKDVTHPAWQEMKANNFPKEWYFGNLPYLIDTENEETVKLPISETEAIVMYILKKANNTTLDQAMRDDPVNFFMYLGVLRDLKGAITTTCYTGKDVQEVTEKLGSVHNMWAAKKMIGLEKRIEAKGN